MTRDHDRPRRAVGAAGDRGDVGGPPDAAVPPVAHDDRSPTACARRSRDGLSPVYVVHANQAAAIERAQALVSLNVTTRAAARGDRRGDGRRADGPRLRRHARPAVRNGVGVHHAGMLPRYRRLVERLAGQGLLPVICGTDTLGVGVNIPIRTVLMTALTKFDGTRVRRFTRPRVPPARRAGRAARLRPRRARVGAGARARHRERQGAGPGRRRSQGPAQGDQGQGARRASCTTTRRRWSASSTARPEPLTSRFRVTADLVASVLVATRRPGGAEAPAAHEPRPRAAPPPAPAPGDRRVPQPRGGRRGRAAARRRRPLPRRARRLARRGRGRAQRAALLVAADDVRHRGDRHVRPRRPGLRRRRRQRRRVGARRSPPGPVRPAERGQGGRGRPPQGRGRAVRGAHGAARVDHVAEAAGRAARRDVHDVPRSTTRG